MAFLESKYVNVFPSAYRQMLNGTATYDPESRLNSERNLTTLNTRLSSQDSYVIGWNKNNSILECSIAGYWFKLDLEDYISDLTTETNIYAYIKLVDRGNSLADNTSYECTSLAALTGTNISPYLDIIDSEDNTKHRFIGLALVNSDPSESYELHLLTKVGGEWLIPEGSDLRFSTRYISDASGSNINSPISDNFTTINLKAKSSLDVEYSNSSVLDVSGGDFTVNGSTNTLKSTTKNQIQGPLTEITSETTFTEDAYIRIEGAPFDYKDVYNKNIIDIDPDADDNTTISIGDADHGYISLGMVGGVSITDYLEVSNQTDASSSTAPLKCQGGLYIDKGAYIKGDLSLGNYSSSNYRLKLINNPGSGVYPVQIDGSTNLTGDLKISSSLYTNGIKAYSGSTLSIDSGTRLSINDDTGASTSSAALYVVGGGTFKNGLRVEYNSIFTGSLSITDSTPSNSYSTGALTTTGGIGVTGNINAHGYIKADSSYIEASYFNATSDRRVKENIKEFKYRKSILDLPIVEFDYKTDGSHHIGCIAQDLKELYPELVHENVNGYLTIEENKLIYLLMEEVKQLKQEIKELKGE